MWKEIFSGASLLDLPLLVMIAFFLLFVGVLIWTQSRRRSPHYAHMASLPLEADGSFEATDRRSKDGQQDD